MLQKENGFKYFEWTHLELLKTAHIFIKTKLK